jgi:hypothetical protein
LDSLLNVDLIIPAWHAQTDIHGRSALDAKHTIIVSTLVRDEVDQDVNHNEGACSPDTCRAVHHDWSGGEALRSKSALLQSDVREKAEHSTGVVGYTMVWPRLEVILGYVSSLGVFAVMVHYKLSKNVVSVGRLIQIRNMYVAIDLVLLNLGPVTSALVLNNHTQIHKINIITKQPSVWGALTLPLSTSLVVITMTRAFSCQIIFQRSSTVPGRHP